MLKGDKIYLRSFQLEDKERTIKWKNDMAIRKMAMYHPYPITKELEADLFDNILHDESNKHIYFAICEKESDKMVGFISLRNINWVNRNCEFGIIIGKENARGKGFGKEATKLIIDYAFKYLNLHKISLNVLEENKPAINLYKNLGFKEEGILKEHFYWDGKYYGVIIMGLLREVNDK